MFYYCRQNKAKMTESLFVMASHGVLLEYTLETLPDVNNKDNICESSPIKLQVCLKTCFCKLRPYVL